MFEQMGATVSYNAGSQTVTVRSPVQTVKVTVGKPEVMINGETRPLDVPPMMYQGSVLVPVRVISEGMGAYVQWVPEQTVVVRYLPPTPPPPHCAATPAPVTAPTVAPTPTPAPVATPYKDIFIAGDYIFSPKVYNEFSPGNTGKSSYCVPRRDRIRRVQPAVDVWKATSSSSSIRITAPARRPPAAGLLSSRRSVERVRLQCRRLPRANFDGRFGRWIADL